jgi:uncharacterized membrane protein YgaE (UPF0421/DUF939 family)
VSIADRIVEETPAPHIALTMNRLTVAFNVWAVVVGGSAALVITFLMMLSKELSAFHESFNAYTITMERRVTQLEEHDKLSDQERARNTLAIAQLNKDVEQVQRDLAEHRANGKK